jgi:hypothetical protein
VFSGSGSGSYFPGEIEPVMTSHLDCVPQPPVLGVSRSRGSAGYGGTEMLLLHAGASDALHAADADTMQLRRLSDADAAASDVPTAVTTFGSSFGRPSLCPAAFARSMPA